VLGHPSQYTSASLGSPGCPDPSCGHTWLQGLPEDAGLSFAGPQYLQVAVPQWDHPHVQHYTSRCSRRSPTWADIGAGVGLEGSSEGEAGFHKPARALLVNGKPRGGRWLVPDPSRADVPRAGSRVPHTREHTWPRPSCSRPASTTLPWSCQNAPCGAETQPVIFQKLKAGVKGRGRGTRFI